MFTPDGKRVTYDETHNSVTNLWELSRDGSARTQITNFTSEEIFNSVITADTLVMARAHQNTVGILICDFDWLSKP